MKTCKELFFLLIFFCIFCTSVSAQDTLQHENEDNGSKIIANINIADGEIIEQDGRTVKAEFIIMNDGDTVQSDIRYAVELLSSKVSEDDPTLIRYETLDTHVFQRSLSLAPGESHVEKVTYSVPDIFSGDLVVGVFAATAKGLPLAKTQVGNISITDINTGVEIVDCRLNVSDDEDDYNLIQGVDIGKEETLFLTCGLINRANEKISVAPQIATYEQTIFGDVLDIEKQDILNIDAKDYREFMIELSKPLKSQAYDVVFSVVSEDAVISNSVRAHYVLRGESGTIKSIQTDKQIYKNGDIASITFFITQRADNFQDARMQEQDSLEEQNIFYSATITDENGSVCGSLMDQKIQDQKGLVKAEIPIKKDCQKPYVHAHLTNEDRRSLDEVHTEIYPEEKSARTWDAKGIDGMPRALIAVFITTCIVIIFIFIMRKRSGMKVLVFIFIAGATFFITQVDNAHALTFTVPAPSNWGDGETSMTVSVNAPSSTRAASVNITGTAVMGVCGNNSARGKVYVNGTKVGENFYGKGEDADEYHGTESFTYAKSVSLNCGENTFPIRGEYWWHDLYEYSANKEITIIRDCERPKCGSRNTIYSASTTNYLSGSTWCTSGNETNFSGGPDFPVPGSQKTWNCINQDGGESVSCIARRDDVQPDCGSAHTNTYTARPTAGLCSTGSANNETETDSTYNWMCGSSDCYANKKLAVEEVVVDCGAADGGSYTARPTLHLCSTGSADWSDEIATDGTYNWKCDSAICSANKKVVAYTPAGDCGLSHKKGFSSQPTTDLCTSGNARWTDAEARDGFWDWYCGSNRCWAETIPSGAACGVASGGIFSERSQIESAGMCRIGRPSSTIFFYDSDGECSTSECWEWFCHTEDGSISTSGMSFVRCHARSDRKRVGDCGDEIGTCRDGGTVIRSVICDKKNEFMDLLNDEYYQCKWDFERGLRGSWLKSVDKVLRNSIYENGTIRLPRNLMNEYHYYQYVKTYEACVKNEAQEKLVRKYEDQISCSYAYVNYDKWYVWYCPRGFDTGSTRDGSDQWSEVYEVMCSAEIVCGNGRMDRWEECDDGNMDDGDGCSGACKIENTCASENAHEYPANANDWTSDVFCENGATLSPTNPHFPSQGRTAIWYCSLNGHKSKCTAQRLRGPSLVVVPEEGHGSDGRMIEAQP